jgi:hypothetical protein
MIALVCALKCEAESLIQHFKLRAVSQRTLFPLYINPPLFLVISGIGKVRAASAVSYLYSFMGDPKMSAWLNVGIGGHPSKEIGKGFFANKVTDMASGQKFYPVFTWKENNSQTVFTADALQTKMPDEGIYEMEAFGFCNTAALLTTAEMIHCFKVVSDNSSQPPSKDPDFVHELIQKQIPAIEKTTHHLAELLGGLKKETSVSTSLAPFLEKWHFTESEFYQLRRLLERWEALLPDHPPLMAGVKDVLTYLNQSLCFL